MVKKKILFVIPSFKIGGTIVSLHSILSVIDTEKYDVSVFALNKSGNFLHKLPNCKIIPENIWLSLVYNGDNIFKKLFSKLLRYTRSIFYRLGYSIEPICCKMAEATMRFDNYDTLVNFSESIARYVAYYPITKRVAWIHCDYRRHLDLVRKNENKEYNLFSTIVCVSNFAKEVFCNCIPEVSNRVVAIHNIINVDDILNKSRDSATQLDPKFKTDNFTIISVGRIDPVKQFHLIPQLAADIKSRTSRKFQWYIIGGYRGFDQYIEKLKQDIKRLNVSEEVILLGEKTNIYPYMANANLYVSTSFSESFPLVINEAKVLGIPVVSNNFGSASESVRHGVDGFISPIESGEMTEKICQLINSPFMTDPNITQYMHDEYLYNLEKIYSIL